MPFWSSGPTGDAAFPAVGRVAEGSNGHTDGTEGSLQAVGGHLKVDL